MGKVSAKNKNIDPGKNYLVLTKIRCNMCILRKLGKLVKLGSNLEMEFKAILLSQ